MSLTPLPNILRRQLGSFGPVSRTENDEMTFVVRMIFGQLKCEEIPTKIWRWRLEFPDVGRLANKKLSDEINLLCGYQ